MNKDFWLAARWQSNKAVKMKTASYYQFICAYPHRKWMLVAIWHGIREDLLYLRIGTWAVKVDINKTINSL